MVHHRRITSMMCTRQGRSCEMESHSSGISMHTWLWAEARLGEGTVLADGRMYGEGGRLCQQHVPHSSPFVMADGLKGLMAGG